MSITHSKKAETIKIDAKNKFNCGDKNPLVEMADNEKIDTAAELILKLYRKAFEELAK